MQESSTKPYLIRALHEWCTDNGYTPHIVVSVDENTVVPFSHVQDGQITLNLGLLATNQLRLGNEYIDFQARFNGITEDIFVPVAAVSAIYARETGAGMGFEVAESEAYTGSTDESTQSDAPAAPASADTPSTAKPSHLKVVK
ncbi:ClpXP protease specificity-enhancing factor [Paenalcaligenes niemegkensis]|uniref:ClpXP protease specificity-enhancing factor n=1 Tax=Paenalcaligenes niemegkensis TaxID=2895469 RepID=UPI001EE7DA3E|nr:ClpXP protease specificity-enhancing factor [Paenalcaligenes niemegkensis]MCQ9618112.1 ClpXP protease specificity-enhancing factor [Paenalcaligenes niemegkensis]